MGIYKRLTIKAILETLFENNVTVLVIISDKLHINCLRLGGK